MKELEISLLKEFLGEFSHRSVGSLRKSITDWANVFRLLKVSSNQDVVEFGSGMSPKIQCALASVSFRGELKIVDLDRRALMAQRIVATVLRSRFRVKTLEADLFNYSLDGADILASNHFIDDAIAANFALRYSIDYQNIYSDALKQDKFWKEIGDEGVCVEDTVKKLTMKISELDSGIVITNHYTSLFDRIHKIEGRDQVCNQALDYFADELKSRGFDDILLDTSRGNSEKRWVILGKNIRP